MDTPQTGSKLHPVLWVAAVAVTILSAVGIGAITGVLPFAGSTSKPPEPAAATAPAPQPAANAPLAAAPTGPAPAVVPEPVPEPKKHVAHAKPKAEPVAQADTGSRAVERAPVRTAEAPVAPPPPPICRDCGVIDSVREIKTQGEGTGLGAVAGGVLGGVLGHQIGGGRGKDVATVVGAVGGAVAGHQVEKSVRSGSKFEITVRFDDGSSQVFRQDQAPTWRTGDRVKVVNGVITAN